MPVSERRAFWASELSRCVKCYACRSSCPMCYCERCTMDCNRPQWIPVASHAIGNLEYHMVRAMHLAGRCVQCGTCGAACPVGIPVHLLTFFAEGTVRRQFGQKGGASAKLDYAMSTFKPDDKETFIR
jgi:ferredoxin